MATKTPDAPDVPCAGRYVTRQGHMTLPVNVYLVQPPLPASVSQAWTDAACQLWAAGPFVQLQDSYPELLPLALTVVALLMVLPLLVTQEGLAPAVRTMQSRSVQRRATALTALWALIAAQPTPQRQNWQALRGLRYQGQAPARQPGATK